MKRIWIASLLVLTSAAAVLALAAGSGSATPSQTATLVVMRDQSDFSEIGWYASFPGFSDSGSWTSDFRAGGGGKSQVYAGVLKTTETGGKGAFATQWQVLATPTSFGGTCSLSGLTGAYAGLHGTGSWSYSETSTTRLYTCVAGVHWN